LYVCVHPVRGTAQTGLDRTSSRLRVLAH